MMEEGWVRRYMEREEGEGLHVISWAAVYNTKSRYVSSHIMYESVTFARIIHFHALDRCS